MSKGIGLEDHIRWRRSKGSKSISKKEVEYIQTNLINGFTLDNLDFPLALCNGCHLKLHNNMMGKETELPIVLNYDPLRPQLLHDFSQCTCKICQVAKSSAINSKLKKNVAVPSLMKRLNRKTQDH